MKTQIEIKERTKEKLNKHKMPTESYDRLINRLLDEIEYVTNRTTRI